MATNLEANLEFPPGLFPVQGKWTEADYFRLETERFVELVNGCIEVLPMPTLFHQRILQWLLKQFEAWCEASRIGEAFMAPVPMKLFSGTIREPDLFIIPRNQETPYPDSALLVLEVVSEGEEARKRDYVEKRADYAKAGVPEYWIVDPLEKAVTILRLQGAEYILHGRFEHGETAASPTLEGFSVNSSQIWARVSKQT